MKNTTRIIVPALVLLLAVAGGDAARAGLFGKSKDKRAEQPKAWRFDRRPTMNFARGTVSRDVFNGWEMDGVAVQFAKGCTVYDGEGRRVDLEDGDEVVVMGARAGGTILAWQVRVLDPDFKHHGTNPLETVTWSESDPTVGMGTGPN